jgi:hypothetical protein
MSIEKQIEDRLAEIRGHITNLQSEERRLAAALAALRGQAVSPVIPVGPTFVPYVEPFPRPDVVWPRWPDDRVTIGDPVNPPFTVTCIDMQDSIASRTVQ